VVLFTCNHLKERLRMDNITVQWSREIDWDGVGIFYKRMEKMIVLKTYEVGGEQ